MLSECGARQGGNIFSAVKKILTVSFILVGNYVRVAMWRPTKRQYSSHRQFHPRRQFCPRGNVDDFIFAGNFVRVCIWRPTKGQCCPCRKFFSSQVYKLERQKIDGFFHDDFVFTGTSVLVVMWRNGLEGKVRFDESFGLAVTSSVLYDSLFKNVFSFTAIITKNAFPFFSGQ